MAMVGDGAAMMGNVHSPHIRGEALLRTNWLLDSQNFKDCGSSWNPIRHREAIGLLATKQRFRA